MSLNISRKAGLAIFAIAALSGFALSNGGASAATYTTGSHTLNEDVTDGIYVDAGNEVTINLNGHSVTNSTANEAAIINKGTLTITGNGTVSTDQAGTAAVTNYTNSTMTISGGTYTSDKWYIIRNYGNMTINEGATITASEANVSNASMVTNGWAGSSDHQNNSSLTAGSGSYEPVLTINGGEFTAGERNCSVIKNDDYGNLEINDGVFKQPVGSLSDCDAVLLNWNVAEVKGGSFFSENGPVVSNGAYADPADKGLITISGGTFTIGENGSVLGYTFGGNGTGAMTVTGGTFSTSLYEMPVNPGAANNGKYYTIEISGGTYGTNFTKDTATLIKNGYGVYKDADDKYQVLTVADAQIPGILYLERGKEYDLGAVLNDTAKTYGTFDFAGIESIALVYDWKIAALQAGEGMFSYYFADTLNTDNGGQTNLIVYAPASEGEDADAAQVEASDIVETIVGDGTASNFEYADGVNADTVKDAAADGATFATTVATNDVDADDIAEDDKTKIADEMEESLTEDAVLLGYYDIDIRLLAIKDNNATMLGNITELASPLTITLTLPEDLEEVVEGYTRTYYLVRVHDGETTLIKATDNGDGTISFDSDKFSTYAVVYEDAEEEEEEEVVTPDTGSFTGEAGSEGTKNALFATIVALTTALISGYVMKRVRAHRK